MRRQGHVAINQIADFSAICDAMRGYEKGLMVPRGGIEPPTLRFSVALIILYNQGVRRVANCLHATRDQWVGRDLSTRFRAM